MEMDRNELNSKTRILLEICDKVENTFGVVSLSTIDHQIELHKLEQFHQLKKDKYKFGLEAEGRYYNMHLKNYLSIKFRRYVLSRKQLYMIKNMCMGFEVEGLEHDCCWHNNQPKMSINYFITRSIFTKKIISKN